MYLFWISPRGLRCQKTSSCRWKEWVQKATNLLNNRILPCRLPTWWFLFDLIVERVGNLKSLDRSWKTTSQQSGWMSFFMCFVILFSLIGVTKTWSNPVFSSFSLKGLQDRHKKAETQEQELTFWLLNRTSVICLNLYFRDAQGTYFPTGFNPFSWLFLRAHTSHPTKAITICLTGTK